MGFFGGGKKDSHPIQLVPTFVCPKCGATSYPLGTMPVVLPCQMHVKCPKCGYEQDTTWFDRETNLQNVKKNVGLLNPKEKSSERLTTISKEIEVLKASRDADRSELQLIRQQVDNLLNQEIERVKSDAKERDEMLSALIQRVKELEDWRKFADEKK